jgi:DNA anti-recombination protein RmuC
MWIEIDYNPLYPKAGKTVYNSYIRKKDSAETIAKLKEFVEACTEKAKDEHSDYFKGREA